MKVQANSVIFAIGTLRAVCLDRDTPLSMFASTLGIVEPLGKVIQVLLTSTPQPPPFLPSLSKLHIL